MVANETGLTDLTLETVWNVYDTLFCEVSLLACPVGLLFSPPQQVQVTRTENTMPGYHHSQCRGSASYCLRNLGTSLMGEKNLRVGNSLLAVSSLYSSLPRALMV
jgi:hypothetical protein